MENETAEDIFKVGAALKFQRTSFYNLIGQVAGINSLPIQKGLVMPLNLQKNTGMMEGVNAIVWEAVHNSKTVVIKGMLPLNSLEGYDHQFENQDSEYKVPLSFPPHENIIKILHSFVGSSALVYPWISEEIRALNIEIENKGGRRFIRKYTTYIVMEFFPATLRVYIESLSSVSERQLCMIALQLLSGVAHMSEYRVCHRDIKDDNIFMSKEGKLVIGDFGCALNCGSLIYQSTADLTSRIGNSYSIAPEVHKAIKLGPVGGCEVWEIMKKNDVFAVGALLYSILNISLPDFNNYDYVSNNGLEKVYIFFTQLFLPKNYFY